MKIRSVACGGMLTLALAATVPRTGNAGPASCKIASSAAVHGDICDDDAGNGCEPFHLTIEGHHFVFEFRGPSEGNIEAVECSGDEARVYIRNASFTFALDESGRATRVTDSSAYLANVSIDRWSGQQTFSKGLAPGETDKERRAREERERQAQAAQRAEEVRTNEAHQKELRDSFKGTKKPVSPEIRRDKEACLRSDALACERLKPPVSPSRAEECHQRQTIAFQTCHSKSNACRRKCENDRFQCTKAACDAACTKNPNGLQCNLLCTCPREITCDCDFCQGVGKMCGDTPAGQTQVK